VRSLSPTRTDRSPSSRIEVPRNDRKGPSTSIGGWDYSWTSRVAAPRGATVDLSVSGSDSRQHFGDVEIVEYSNASGKPHDLNELDAARRIYAD
jgi:hypothetical protein